MKQAVARDSLTVLPSDRALNIRIADFGGSIRGISYEVRKMCIRDRTRTVEYKRSCHDGSIHIPLVIYGKDGGDGPEARRRSPAYCRRAEEDRRGKDRYFKRPGRSGKGKK